MSIDDVPARQRFARTMRFGLTSRGLDSEKTYQASIVASRNEPGRASFDSACAAWAQSFGVRSEDGLYLSEVRDAPLRSDELVRRLETSGKTRSDVRAAVERLVDAGLLEALPTS